MPNHVINEIVLHGVSLDRASPYILNEKGEVSFAVLLPLPINFWPGSVSSEHEKAFPGTHLDAAATTWGTKWDAYGNPAIREDCGSTVITFQSAWAHPRGWTCALLNTLNCGITVNWLDEGCQNGMREQYAERDDVWGLQWTTEPIPAGTEEHRRLHKLLWGLETFDDEENSRGE